MVIESRSSTSWGEGELPYYHYDRRMLRPTFCSFLKTRRYPHFYGGIQVSHPMENGSQHSNVAVIKIPFVDIPTGRETDFLAEMLRSYSEKLVIEIWKHVNK